MMENDILVFNSKFSEFEFDEYSVFYDHETKEWFLETYGDEDDSVVVILEDETTEFNEELTKDFNFAKKDFDRLKNFVTI